jgi:hypothetical protein
MTTRIATLMLCATLLAVPAAAADVDGTWSGSLDTPMGVVPITFEFKAEGEKLTGTMIGMEGAKIPLANGKVEGDKISYTVTIDLGGMPLEMNYKGVVAASEIKLDMEVFGMPFSLVVKKAP